MRGEAMKALLCRLEEVGEPLAEYDALEYFARAGDWQTTTYASRVRTVTAWEIMPDHEAELRRNLPNAHIRIGDSYELAHEERYLNSVQFIVMDNPQGIFGKYCEHFEALPLVRQLVSRKGGVVIFNINRHPFDYEKNPLWKKRRSEYYGRDASDLEVDFLLEFYSQRFSESGLNTRFSFEQPRNKEYLSYMVFGVSSR